MSKCAWLIAGAAMIGSTAPAMAQTVVPVTATGDLFNAGRPAGTTCCNGDASPAQSPVQAPLTLSTGEYLTFSATGGAAHYPSEVASPTADGDTSFTYNLTADYGTGISGPTNIHLNGLAGVFLGPDQPTGAAPAQLTGTDFTTLSPGLGQIFFIGDGLTGTGTGTVQTFYLPTGATRLFLGIADDGGYYDNYGTITATINAFPLAVSGVPEPATWAMIVLGVGIAGRGLRNRRATRVRYA